MEETTKRTRMNISLSVKGVAQWDITAEYAFPEDAAKHLGDAIDKVREILKAKGLTEAGAV
jgi:hypothetical protein